MTRPAPCPHCHTDRVWARAAVGVADATRMAFCPTCGRAAALGSFAGAAPAPPLMQRVADDIEAQASGRYVRRRQLVGMLAEAARRADALARLEAALLQPDPRAA